MPQVHIEHDLTWVGQVLLNPVESASMVLASRASGCLFDTQTLKKHTSGHPEFLERNFLKCQFQEYN